MVLCCTKVNYCNVSFSSSAADFLMGIYLFIIAVQDVRFRGHYREAAYDWVHSISCRLTGLLAMLSSEVSLLILTVISLERYLIITHPYKLWKLTAKNAFCVMACIWAVGLSIAVFPMLVMGKQNLYPNVFYGSNGLCFPLHLRYPYEPGWQISIFIFLGINFTCMVTISFCYLAMFYNSTLPHHLVLHLLLIALGQGALCNAQD